MRIGLVSFHALLRPGGVKRHVFGLHKEFQKRLRPPHHLPAESGPLEIYSRIIAPRRSLKEKYGKDVILLGTSFPLSVDGTQTDFCINFNPQAIERTLRREKFDILHFHNFGFPSIFQILKKSKALNILTFHTNIDKSEFLKNFPTILYYLQEIVKWGIDGVIGVAPKTLDIFKDFEGPKIVIPNGIDLEEFNPKIPKIKEFRDGKINILFVGRIEKRKGLIYLLKAYSILEKKYSPLRLIIVGEGPLKQECQKWVEKQGLEQVFFEGEVTGKKLPPYYTSSDIFVSPAVFGESFGIVLLEALACGVPVVAFANRGYKEFLEGKRGEKFLVKPRDYEALAEKIEILIKDENLRKEIGKQGITEAREYAWPKIANQVLDFYGICQKEKRKKPKEDLSLDKMLNKIYNKRQKKGKFGKKGGTSDGGSKIP